MSLLLLISVGMAALSLAVWLCLLLARGRFWRTDIQLNAEESGPPDEWPSVAVIVPARSEAAVLPETLPTLFNQEYPGEVRIYLVNDQSSDGTTSVARRLAQRRGGSDKLNIVEGSPLPANWAGKVWAMEQGVRATKLRAPCYLWLTDADIAHSPSVLKALVIQAESNNVSLVSVAAQLHCRGFWERLLVPAFIYFFSKLFPFPWVNDPNNPMAAAAGGCILVRWESLEPAGGLQNIANAIIDDCALANLIKGHRPRSTTIWLGLSHDITSVRTYGGLWPFWQMVARTAYTQLRDSPVLLLGTLVGMTLVYMVPLAAIAEGRVALGVIGQSNLSLTLFSIGLVSSCLMIISYMPVLQWYRTSRFFSLLFPLAAMLYMMMTLDSARRYWQGRGGKWKDRTYDRNLELHASQH